MPTISSFQHILRMIKTLNKMNGALFISKYTHWVKSPLNLMLILVYATFLLVSNVITCNVDWFNIMVRTVRQTLKLLPLKKMPMIAKEHQVGLFGAATSFYSLQSIEQRAIQWQFFRSFVLFSFASLLYRFILV